MKLLDWLLRRVTPIQDEPEIVPMVGEYWQMISLDPFPSKYPPVKVIGVKDGWVRYDMGKLFNDERMEIKIFKMIYRKCEGDL